MKKLLVAFIAVAFVFGLVAQTAVAEERLAISGAMRARAWSTTNYSDLDSDNKTDELSFWDQRFRMQSVISPADGVKAVLRCDFSETTWGTAGTEMDSPRPTAGTNNQFQVDRAYLDITKGMINVKAGQQYMGLGINFAYDNNATGLQLTINTPVVIRLGWSKESEGGAYDVDGDWVPVSQYATTDLDASDTGAASTQDIDQYFLDVTYKADTFTVEGFYAMQKDSRNSDDTVAGVEEPTLFGVMGKFAVGPVNVLAELDMFGGQANDNVDYTGTQFVGDVSFNLSDMVALGVDVVYSTGNKDNDKEKICYMPHATFGSTGFADFGAFQTDLFPLGACDVFDPLGTEAGSLGGGVWAKIVPMEALTIYGQVAYLMGQEDETGMFENGTVFNLSGQWGFTQNAHLALGYNYTSASIKDVDNLDNASAIMARIQVDF